jgi:hypothetical protein
MLTVEEVNSTFAEKGLQVKLPLPEHFLVKSLDVLEKRETSGGVGLLLSVRFINDQGEEVADLFFCEGAAESRRKKALQSAEIKQPPKSELLPHRSTESFENDGEALVYLGEAVTHLLHDKGYQSVQHDGVDLCFEDRGDRFYVNLAIRLDEAALERAKQMAELRLREGVDHEYGLVVPAFQESLGVPLLLQDRWMFRNHEYLAANRIGIYAVDNWNPNLVYGFTIYPQSRELKRYFMTTGSQWHMVRQRYVAGRSQRRREAEL